MTALSIRILLKEQLNKLHSKNYSSESIIDCFSSLKTESVWEKHDQQQFIVLLEQIIQNVDLDWLSSLYSKALVLETLSRIDSDIKILGLTSYLYKFRHGCRLDFIIELLQQCFKRGCYKELILNQTQISSKVSQNTWEKLISCISSLPDHIANKVQSKKSYPLFHHENFFVFIGVQMAEIVESLVIKVNHSVDIDVTFLSYNIGQICICSKAAFLYKSLFPLLIAKSQGYIWQRILHQLFCKISDRCIDKVLFYMFKHAPNYHCLKPILGDVVSQNPKAKFVITHKFLLSYSSSDCTVARNVIGYLSSCDPTFSLLTEVLHKLLTVWCLPSAIKHTSYEQHRYVTVAILSCAAHLKDKLNEKSKSDTLSLFMSGVNNHLDSPDEKIRLLGMIVAEKLADLVKFGDQQNKLTFEYRHTEEAKFLFSLDELVPEPDKKFYEDQFEIYKKIKKNLDDINVDCPTEVAYSVGKSNFLKMAETHHIDLKPLDGAQVSNLSHSTNENQESEPDSDDDDLVPFDLPEEKPFSKVSRPLYIRDCLEGLIENKDREHMEIYLECVEELIEADRFAAKEVAVELCRVLLNLQDNYAIDGFSSQRRRGIVAAIMSDPKSVADYLTSEFYSENYNLVQRSDMLDVLVMAAGRLSGIDKHEGDSQVSSSADENKPGVENSLPWQKLVEKRIESKTRRFGKARKVQQTARNQFSPVAGYFFFPLMAGFDRRIRTLDLLGKDSMILGRLLYALGTIIYANAHSTSVEDMAISLLEFVAQMRCHAEASVRKACVYCVTMATMSVRALTERLGDVSLEARDWLCDVIEHDEDLKAREMALNTVAMMNNKVRKELGMEGS